MKMNKVKDQQEGIKNAKLFYEAVKLAWGLQVTYCYHDLIHMIKNDWSYDLYDSDNWWGMGAKNQKDGDVCTFAEIFKKDDEESEEEEEQEEEDDEIEAAHELIKKFNELFYKMIRIFHTFRLPPVWI